MAIQLHEVLLLNWQINAGKDFVRGRRNVLEFAHQWWEQPELQSEFQGGCGGSIGRSTNTKARLKPVSQPWNRVTIQLVLLKELNEAEPLDLRFQAEPGNEQLRLLSLRRL